MESRRQMDMESDIYSVRARYLFPGDRPPVRDGCLVMREGKILEVGHEPAGIHYDLGEALIIPALVNAHTHLEFSQLAQPLQEPGTSFTDWLRSVVRWRRKQAATTPGVDWRTAAIQQGIQECARTGTAAVGEIATMPMTSGTYPDSMCGVVFFELLGLAPDREPQLLQAAHKFTQLPSPWLATHPAKTAQMRLAPGLSPHAPYTVSLSLLEGLVSIARARHVPVAMHLAETREELELLAAASGPFVRLLEELGGWYPALFRSPSTPLDYLQRLTAADRALVVHGNYLSAAELDFVIQHHEQLSVVYCPRTHSYFGHDPYPLPAMLELGVPVALGTDSRASTSNLSMWDELRFAARKHSDVSPQQLLRLATIQGAQALGLAGQVGVLSAGAAADFLVLNSSTHCGRDPYDLLFQDETNLGAVYRCGVAHSDTLS